MSKISALNVAEKPSVAKSVSQILSRGSSVNKVSITSAQQFIENWSLEIQSYLGIYL